jgi:hypothetical protein
VVAVLAAGGLTFALTRDNGGSSSANAPGTNPTTKAGAQCAHGVAFTAAPVVDGAGAPISDGTVIGSSSSGRVGQVAAGALFGFSSRQDWEDAGHADVQLVDDPVYDAAVQARPKGGYVLATSATASQPQQQLFLTAGGAIFPIGVSTGPGISVPKSVAGLRVEDIPPRMVREEFYVPQGGTLLHVKDSKQYWLVNGTSRQLATPCKDATIVELPAIPGILGKIPRLYG